MNHALIKGYGGVNYIDGAGHRYTNSIANDITDVGLDRILSADRSLYDTRHTFSSIILTHGLPEDRDVFTRDELNSYGARIYEINNVSRNSGLVGQISTNYTTYEISSGNNPITYDLISLAYTDGSDNWFIGSRAKAFNPVTLDVSEFVIPSHATVSVFYNIRFSFHSGDGATLSGIITDLYTNRHSTIDGQSITYTNDKTGEVTRTTRIPYVPGSFKAEWIYDINSSSRTTASTYFPLEGITFGYNIPVPTGKARGKVELEFIRHHEVEKIGIELVAPGPIIETVSLKYTDSYSYTLKLRATPLTQIYLTYDDRLVASIFTDIDGSGTCKLSHSYLDSNNNSYRQVTDGIEFTATLVNDAGRYTHPYVPLDDTANPISAYYWKDNDTLHLIGRYNDKVEIFIHTGYIEGGETISNLTKVATVLLETRNVRYGVDGATADLKLDLVKDYKLLHGSKITIRVTDAAGNTSTNHDRTIKNIGNLNLNGTLVSSNTILYSQTLNVGTPVYPISLITKGSIS